MYLGISIHFFFLLDQVQYTQYQVVYLAQITYLCTYFYLYITLSFIADETNELCTGGEILPEDSDDKTDDGRCYDFGV